MADLDPRDIVTPCDMSQPVTGPRAGAWIDEIEKLVRSPAAMQAAMRGSLALMERGLFLYPPDWATPALAAMEGDVCVGVLCLTYDADDSVARVDLAWCDPAHPSALKSLLLRLRRIARSKGLRYVRFLAHTANDDMAKAGKALGAEPFTLGYRIDITKEPG